MEDEGNIIAIDDVDLTTLRKYEEEVEEDGV